MPRSNRLVAEPALAIAVILSDYRKSHRKHQDCHEMREDDSATFDMFGGFRSPKCTGRLL